MRHTGLSASLPPSASIVFFDWHGVLCLERFWHSILDEERHPARASLVAFADSLFADQLRVDAWMRGALSLDDVVRDWPMSRPWDATFVRNRAIRDCGTMRVLPKMASLVRDIRERCLVVVATDNMDCFAIAAHDRRDLRESFDGIICSSEVGLLKRDDPAKFFAAFLGSAENAFGRGILIDDSEANCAAFTTAGGRAILHRDAERTRAELTILLDTRHPPLGPTAPSGSRTISTRNDATA